MAHGALRKLPPRPRNKGAGGRISAARRAAAEAALHYRPELDADCDPEDPPHVAQAPKDLDPDPS